MSPATLIRNARRAAGFTQASLASRLGTTQSAIARLEAEGSNPRVDTLTRALAVCGQQLRLDAQPHRSSIDETLVAGMLRMSPGERIKSFERSYAEIRGFALAAASSRGELA